MLIFKVLVDKVPEDCAGCHLRNGNYCTIKALSEPCGNSFLKKEPGLRDPKCPLQEVKLCSV